MAVGQWPKLTMPILVRINFKKIKMTQIYFAFSTQNDQKTLISPYLAGW